MELPNIIQQFIGNSVLEPNKIGQSRHRMFILLIEIMKLFFLSDLALYIQRPHTVSLVKRKC